MTSGIPGWHLTPSQTQPPAQHPLHLPQTAPPQSPGDLVLCPLAVAGSLQFCPKRMMKASNLEVRPATPLVGSLHLTEDVAIYFLPSLVQNMKHLFSLWHLCTQTASDLLPAVPERKLSTLTGGRGPHGGNDPVEPRGCFCGEPRPPPPSPVWRSQKEGGAKYKEPPTLPLGTPRPAAWSVKCTLWPGRPASGMGIQASVSFNIKRRQERAGESEASGSPRPREGRILPVALPAISRTAASVDPLLRLS